MLEGVAFFAVPGTVLVVEDDPAILELITFQLDKAGYRVIAATDGREALDRFRASHPDLILLDLMLPTIDGLEVCRRIRRVSSVPIIMVTARGQEDERILGLQTGADDYITKPFSPRELVARVEAVLRRTQAAGAAEAALVAGDLVLDRRRRRVTVAGREVELTPKEFDLLALLMAHQGEALERDTLFEHVWGYAYAGGTRTVDVHIRRLRQKIGDDPQNPRYIETVHGIGYRFREQEL